MDFASFCSTSSIFAWLISCHNVPVRYHYGALVLGTSLWPFLLVDADDVFASS